MSRVNNTIDKFGRQKFQGGRSLRGPSGIGFKLTEQGHYDIQNKILTNVAPPLSPDDAVNKEYVLDQIGQLRKTVSDLISKSLVQHFTLKINEINKKLQAIENATKLKKKN